MDFIFRMLAEHVYIILFISLILEFAALPLPGETMMVAAGVIAYNGYGNYYGMLIASALGTIIGMQFSYEVGNRLGTKAINKFGKYIGLTEERMNKASEIFNKHGNIVIVVAYFLPGVRHIMGYFSGITKIDAKRFHIYSTVGGIFWVLTFISLGYLLGPSAEKFSDEIHKYGILLFALFAVAFTVYFVIKKMKKKRNME